MSSVALFRGPNHVMEWCDEETIAIGGRDGRGAPVREMFPEQAWAEAQAAMDVVWRTGSVIRLNRPHGLLILMPRVDESGHVFGVATYLQLAPQLASTLDPESRAELPVHQGQARASRSA
jgi:hypothetical protein